MRISQGSTLVLLVSLLMLSFAVFGQQTPSCTIFVQPGQSIQAAIDKAPEGAVICLPAGTWNENITIEKTLTLRGKGPERTVIDGVQYGRSVVRIGGDGSVMVRLQGLRIVGAEGSAEGVRVENSAQATIEGCDISENNVGILLRGSLQATIIECTISENRWEGIVLSGSAQATITENVIQDNRGCGIFSSSTREVRGEGNSMVGNGVDLWGNVPTGLRLPLLPATEQEITYPDPRYRTLQEAVDALLPGGRLVLLAGNYGAGVTIGKKLRIEGSAGAETVLKAKFPFAPVLSLVEGAKVDLGGLKLTGGSEGLVLAVDAQATITDCTISGNGMRGLVLGGSAQATITDCTISGNGDGIRLWDLAHVTIEGCTISGNDSGIELEDSAQAILRDTKIIQNRRYGVVLYQQPCFKTDEVFSGHVFGGKNVILGPSDPDGNGKGAVCPEDLSFLMTTEGGELDWRK